MAEKPIPAGTWHTLSTDLRGRLFSDAMALEVLEDITALAHNE